MKKILQLILLVGVTLGLAACGDDEETTVVEIDPTNFETVQQFIEEFEIPNDDAVLKNVYLPKTIGIDGTIVWETDKSEVLATTGVVNRTQNDEVVNLTAVATLGGTKERFYYTVTVKGLPSTSDGRLSEAIDDFYLTEEVDGKLYVDRDVMSLPRVTDLYTVFIDWDTSDDAIVDLEGNVYRTDVEQTVELTANFSYNEFENYGTSDSVTTVTATSSKKFNVTIGTTSDDSPAVIDSTLPQILNKVEVENISELIVALSDPQPGDAIILKDGEYKDLKYTISNSGTAENPIYIFAENPGDVKMTGISQIIVEASHVVIANLKFVDGSPYTDTGVIVFDGHYNRLTNCVIDGFEQAGNGYKWVSLTGSHHEIDRNFLTNKTTSGSLLTIWREDMETQYHYIHSNHFKNFNDTGGNNGYETIRIGTSDYSQTDSNVLVENNLFEALNGEIEIISVKSGRTIVRNNTFNECLGLVTFRHGKNNVAESNIFYGAGEGDAGGVRMYDGGHIVRNNFMYDLGGNTSTRAAVVVHTGVNIPNANTVLNLQWTSYNILITNNTIVDCDQSILFCNGYTYGSTGIEINGNLIISSSNCITNQGSSKHSGFVFGSNELWGSTAVSAGAEMIEAAGSLQGSRTAANTKYTLSTSNEFRQYSNEFGAQGLVEVTATSVGANFS